MRSHEAARNIGPPPSRRKVPYRACPRRAPTPYSEMQRPFAPSPRWMEARQASSEAGASGRRLRLCSGAGSRLSRSPFIRSSWIATELLASIALSEMPLQRPCRVDIPRLESDVPHRPGYGRTVRIGKPIYALPQVASRYWPDSCAPAPGTSASSRWARRRRGHAIGFDPDAAIPMAEQMRRAREALRGKQARIDALNLDEDALAAPPGAGMAFVVRIGIHGSYGPVPDCVLFPRDVGDVRMRMAARAGRCAHRDPHAVVDGRPESGAGMAGLNRQSPLASNRFAAAHFTVVPSKRSRSGSARWRGVGLIRRACSAALASSRTSSALRVRDGCGHLWAGSMGLARLSNLRSPLAWSRCARMRGRILAHRPEPYLDMRRKLAALAISINSTSVHSAALPVAGINSAVGAPATPGK